MGHSRARRLTTRLGRVIRYCRTELAKVRNERERAAAREAGKEEQARALDQAVRELHARDSEAGQELSQLLEETRTVKERYRRRRERIEREAELQQRRNAEERLRVRQRRKRRRTMRARAAKATEEGSSGGSGSRRKGLGKDHGAAMVQQNIRAALGGNSRAARHSPLLCGSAIFEAAVRIVSAFESNR